MPLLNLNDIKTYYEIHGQGKPMILIAGYTCDHTFWYDLTEKLAKFYQVILFDNRAIGQTKDTGAAFSIATMANDVMSLMDHLQLDQPIIVGQSMGGAIAQTIAIKYPNNISDLIILNSVGKFNLVTQQALASLLNLRKANISLDLLIETSIPWFYSSEYLAKPENIAAIIETIKNNPYPQSIEDQQRQLMALNGFNALSMLDQIKARTLVVGADNDLICPLQETQELSNKIQNSQFINIPGGHGSPVEQPELLSKKILKFLG